MLYFDSIGKSYKLGKSIGQGGEATIYRVKSHPQLLAKIYTQPRQGTEKKLIWMRDNPPDDPSRELNHASIAWPIDLFYDHAKTFAGYLMPHIKNAVLMLHVFNPRLRARTLPSFNELYLHRTARNLAAALGAIHARGYVIGDFNESNVMVTPSTLVTMIDTDSFQVRAPNRIGQTITYHCPVGKPEYTPPELQGKSLARVRRFPEHDRFALAILIFQILMDGNHPFRARWEGHGDPPPIEERINMGWFPLQKRISTPIAPPVNALPLESLDPGIVKLMQRCFIEGHKRPKERPTPEEWENAISQAERSLKPCGKGHYFNDHLSTCPRCARIDVLTQAEQTPIILPSARASSSQPSFKLASRSLVGILTWRRFTPFQLLMIRYDRFRGGINSRLSSTHKIRHVIRNTGRVLRVIFSNPIGKAAMISITVTIGGGLLANWLGGQVGGSITGSVGGLISGALFSEVIHKRLGWGKFLGACGAVGLGWLAWYGDGPIYFWIPAAVLGWIVGALLGRFGEHTGWMMLGAIIGAVGGLFWGRTLGGVSSTAWLGGALSGAAIGVVTAAAHRTWRKFG